MNIDRAVVTLAGSMVLVSLALAWLVSPYWLLRTAFVGANAAAGIIHRMVSGGADVPLARRAERACISMTGLHGLRLGGVDAADQPFRATFSDGCAVSKMPIRAPATSLNLIAIGQPKFIF